MSSIIRVISLTLLLGLLSACANTETSKNISSKQELSAAERAESKMLAKEILMHLPDEVLVNLSKKFLTQSWESIEGNRKEIMGEILKHYDPKLKFNYSKEEIDQIKILYVVSYVDSKEKPNSSRLLNFINKVSVATAAKFIRIIILEGKN